MPVPCVVLPSAPVLLEMVPPEPAVPLPVTVSPPLEPVVLRMMPFAEPLPFEVMVRNVRPVPPIVVKATFGAVPFGGVIVLLLPVTAPVPPVVAAGPGPVAVNAALAPVLKLNPPVKFIVAPVLFV